jgi:hypothetical protein
MTEGEASAIARVRTDDLIDDKRTFLTYAAPQSNHRQYSSHRGQDSFHPLITLGTRLRGPAPCRGRSPLGEPPNGELSLAASFGQTAVSVVARRAFRQDKCSRSGAQQCCETAGLADCRQSLPWLTEASARGLTGQGQFSTMFRNRGPSGSDKMAAVDAHTAARDSPDRAGVQREKYGGYALRPVGLEGPGFDNAANNPQPGGLEGPGLSWTSSSSAYRPRPRESCAP